MSRWLLFPLLVVASVAAAGPAVPAPASAKAGLAVERAKRPNILLIVSDDQGRGDYSAFGTPDVRTPAIDRLYREGRDFTNFYANSPVCSPTRAALLTGLYPDRTGVPGVIRQNRRDSWGYLRHDATMLPALLRKAGYATAMVGKWHLGYEAPNLPNDRGFKFFRGFLGDMMDDYVTHVREGANWMRSDKREIDPKGHATDLFTDWASNYLRSRDKRPLGDRRPFFLYLAYNAPHNPLQPPDDWLERVQRREPGIDRERARLVALIEHMDDGIGRVLQALDDTGEARNTLIVFTSDNGGLLNVGARNGPWRGGKGQLYEGGIRVPGVVRWPMAVPPSSRSERVTLSMDLFPTLLEAAGVPLPEEIDGQSFLSEMKSNTAPDPERELYWVRREGGQVQGGRAIEALRRGPWKLIHNNPNAPRELYNLERDPYEKENLGTREPEKLRELTLAIQAHMQRGGEVPWQSAPRPMGKRKRTPRD